ncbi:casein kinase I isoform delta [Chaetomium strumarium]|uniref:non-specific serine/threonine protein kinase n=1 Tax=Chaetomium strumarium TaxID=1170767 RepID=A0AAJ0GRC2_9PEZI|nr:casein kinase I isoform delta [Chaetomium strumarium]
MKDILIAGKYRVDRKIGVGGFGVVYSGTDLTSDEEVAIKLTFVRDNPEVLRCEKETYEALAGGVGIPRVRWFGQECDFYVLVMDALGPSLEDLLNYCDRKFSLKTILYIADQAIVRIEYIHSEGFLHRDIKPDNFLMGVGRQGNILYTIDFGLAKEFFDAERCKDVEGLALGGTRRYASINNHNGREQSWGDDLESLGYVFVYLTRGSLPWQGLKAGTDAEKDARIKKMKESLSAEALCDGFLPGEFVTYINYTRGLAFDDKPDYLYLQRLFRRRFRAEGFKYDHVFDWTEKLFKERQSQVSSAVPLTRRLQRRAPEESSTNVGTARQPRSSEKILEQTCS